MTRGKRRRDCERVHTVYCILDLKPINGDKKRKNEKAKEQVTRNATYICVCVYIYIDIKL